MSIQEATQAQPGNGHDVERAPLASTETPARAVPVRPTLSAGADRWTTGRDHGRRRLRMAVAVVAGVAVLAALLTAVLSTSDRPGAHTGVPGGPVGRSGAGNPLQVPADAAAALDTDYPVPSDALVVSPAGKDSWAGTAARPLRTIRQAIHLAAPGSTIVVRGGVYREGSSAWVTKSLTIQAYPHEQVWFDGSDLVSAWRRDGTGLWSTSWSTPELCGGRYESRAIDARTASGPCHHPDMATGVVGDPQQAYLDGIALEQYATAAQARHGHGFSYDRATRRLSLGVDPIGHRVELSRRPVGLAVFGAGIRSFVVRGIGFRHYATNEYTNQTSGALVFNRTVGGRIDHVAVTANSGGGALTWQARQLTISSSYFSGNGFDGLWVDGSARTGERDDLTLENSAVDANNADRFGADCADSCAAAGAKMSFLNGAVIRNNSFSRNVGRAAGWWCDTWCRDVTVTGNVVADNGNFGLGYELSDRGLLVDNLVLHNGWVSKAAGVMAGSANTWVYNNSLVDNYAGALLYDDPRSGRFKGHRLPPDTVGLRFVNNVVAGGSPSRPQVDVRAGGPGGAGNTVPSRFVRLSDANSYFRPPGSSPWVYYWEERIGSHELYTNLTALAARRGVERHSTEVTTGGRAPFFVDQATGDYLLDPGFVAASPGLPVPAQVASLLGVRPGEPVGRGATSAVGVGRLAVTSTGGRAPDTARQIAVTSVGPPPTSVTARLAGEITVRELPVTRTTTGWTLTVSPQDVPPGAGRLRLTVSAFDDRGRLVASAVQAVR